MSTSIELGLAFDDHGPKYLEARRTPRTGDLAIFGVAFDGTTSYRPGARFGPDHLRAASVVLENYSPEQDRSLPEDGYCDLGNLEVPMGPPTPMVAAVEAAVTALLAADLIPLMLGGEHSVSTGAVHAVARRYPGLLLVQFDAHGDLRESYLGEAHNHACTMRRCLEIVGERGLIQVGIRSGTREEFAELRETNRWVPVATRPAPAGTPHPMAARLAALIAERGHRPIYLTVDLDAFDPSVMSGTGTPEPGGILWSDFQELLAAIPAGQLVAADVVELAPTLDPSGSSSVLAAKVTREIAIRLAHDRSNSSLVAQGTSL